MKLEVRLRNSSYPVLQETQLFVFGLIFVTRLDSTRSDVQVCHQNPMGSHCTMGQVGLFMGVHCPCLGAPYPTVHPIPLYHGTGETVHGSQLTHLRCPISNCLSYHTVPWDRWDCPWKSNVPSEGPMSHCLSYLSHIMFYSCPTQVQSIQCTMVVQNYWKKKMCCLYLQDRLGCPQNRLGQTPPTQLW